MIVMMGGDDEKKKQNNIFHDFFGMSSDDVDENACKRMEADVSGSSDLGSERLGANNSEVFYFHTKKNAISEQDANNPLSGRKRSSSSEYVNLIRDRMLSSGSDSFENSRLFKAFGKSHDGDTVIPSTTMQPPCRPTSSLSLHQPIRHNPCPAGQFPSRFSQSGSHMGKLNGVTALTSQAAADEGSRTGMKGTGIFKTINSIGTSGTQPCSTRPKTTQIVEPESSNMPSHHNLAYSSRQMTIFYAGQAHVFDDVHPNKADVIMALAGSNGGSWSTNYSNLGVGPPVSGTKTPNGEKELGIDLRILPSGGYQGEEASQVSRLITSTKEHEYK